MQKYQFIEMIGEGAYGVVLKCCNTQNNEIVAIKKFKSEQCDDEEEQTRKKITMREIKLLKNLSHPNVVVLKQAFRRKGTVSLVFEYVENNLLEVLQMSPDGLNPELIRKIIFQLVKGLAYLHQNNVIHRDIKPENLLIAQKTHHLKICDFGFARYMHKSSKGGNHHRKQYTDYVATRWYRPPELLVGAPYGPQIDIWAVGCIMGQLIDGNPLFPSETQFQQLSMIQKTLGPLFSDHYEVFLKNQRYLGMKLPEIVGSLETVDKRYLGKLSKKALNFLKSTLKQNPAQRITALDAVNHPYFEDLLQIEGNYQSADYNIYKKQPTQQMFKKHESSMLIVQQSNRQSRRQSKEIVQDWQLADEIEQSQCTIASPSNHNNGFPGGQERKQYQQYRQQTPPLLDNIDQQPLVEQRNDEESGESGDDDNNNQVNNKQKAKYMCDTGSKLLHNKNLATQQSHNDGNSFNGDGDNNSNNGQRNILVNKGNGKGNDDKRDTSMHKNDAKKSRRQTCKQGQQQGQKQKKIEFGAVPNYTFMANGGRKSKQLHPQQQQIQRSSQNKKTSRSRQSCHSRHRHAPVNGDVNGYDNTQNQDNIQNPNLNLNSNYNKHFQLTVGTKVMGLTGNNFNSNNRNKMALTNSSQHQYSNKSSIYSHNNAYHQHFVPSVGTMTSSNKNNNNFTKPLYNPPGRKAPAGADKHTLNPNQNLNKNLDDTAVVSLQKSSPASKQSPSRQDYPKRVSEKHLDFNQFTSPYYNPHSQQLPSTNTTTATTTLTNNSKSSKAPQQPSRTPGLDILQESMQASFRNHPLNTSKNYRKNKIYNVGQNTLKNLGGSNGGAKQSKRVHAQGSGYVPGSTYTQNTLSQYKNHKSVVNTEEIFKQDQGLGTVLNYIQQQTAQEQLMSLSQFPMLSSQPQPHHQPLNQASHPYQPHGHQYTPLLTHQIRVSNSKQKTSLKKYPKPNSNSNSNYNGRPTPTPLLTHTHHQQPSQSRLSQGVSHQSNGHEQVYKQYQPHIIVGRMSQSKQLRDRSTTRAKVSSQPSSSSNQQKKYQQQQQQKQQEQEQQIKHLHTPNGESCQLNPSLSITITNSVFNNYSKFS